MFFRLFFLLTFVPFVELYILIRMGRAFGWPNTLALILFTGFLGAWQLRRQGASILQAVQQNPEGANPSETIGQGLSIFIGGVLLLTPGVLTDFLGFSLIFPLTQKLWVKYFLRQWKAGVAAGNVKFYSPQAGANPFANQRNPFSQRQDSSSTDRSIDNQVIDIKVKSSTTEDK